MTDKHKNKGKLSKKQEQFCREYIIDFNSSASAVRAGYSKKTARHQASRLLTKVNIQEYIQKLINKRSKKLEITAENVLEEIATIAFKKDEDNNKMKGLELLGKHLKLFTDKIDIAGGTTVNIIKKRFDGTKEEETD